MNQGLSDRQDFQLVFQFEDLATIPSLHEFFKSGFVRDPFRSYFSSSGDGLLCQHLRASVFRAITTCSRHQPPDPHRAGITYIINTSKNGDNGRIRIYHCWSSFYQYFIAGGRMILSAFYQRRAADFTSLSSALTSVFPSAAIAMERREK